MKTSITEKDYLPTTSKELSDQKDLISSVAKMVLMKIKNKCSEICMLS